MTALEVYEVDCSTPDAAPVARDPTPEEAAAFAAQAAAGNAMATREANRAALEARAEDARAQLRAAADALDAGSLTAAQQRAALALCCRTTARLVRLVLAELDAAD